MAMAMDDALMSEKESFFEAMTNELNRVKNRSGSVHSRGFYWKSWCLKQQ